MSTQKDEIIVKEEERAGKNSPRGRLTIFILFFAVLILASLVGLGYWQLTKTNLLLSQLISQTETKVSQQQNTLSNLQQSVTKLDAFAQKSQELAVKQEQILNEWQTIQKGDLNKWYVAEAQYLTKLANDHLQFTHNNLMAVTLLERAEQIIQNLNEATLPPLRDSLTAAITQLKSLPQVDTTQLYSQLSSLNAQIEQLTLPATPLKSEDNLSVQKEPAGTSWWKSGLNHTLEALHKIVIVKYADKRSLPLVMPEEKSFLYQNLHAQMENILWAVLHHNETVYQTGLTRVTLWVQQYFDQDAALTKTMLQTLDNLKKTNIQPSSIQLTSTLDLFDQYFKNVNSSKPTQ